MTSVAAKNFSITRGPRCGRCQYSAIGLETLTCPECGGDFRVVGLIGAHPATPHRRRMPAFLIATLCYTLALLFVGLGSALLLSAVLPTGRVFNSVMKLTPNNGTQYILTARGRSLNDPFPLLPVTVEIVGAKRSSRFIDVANDRVESVDLAGHHQPLPGPFDAAAVRVWLRENGITDPGGPDRIPGAVQELARPETGLTSSSSTSVTQRGMEQVHLSNSAGPPPGAEAVCFALWFVLWFAGVWLMWRETVAPSPRTDPENTADGNK